MLGNVMIVCFVLSVAVVMITIKYSDVTNAIAVITSIALVKGKFLKVKNRQKRRDVCSFLLVEGILILILFLSHNEKAIVALR